MNIVKRFFMNQKNYSTDESNMIPSGQLYLVRSPSSPKSENECLYNDAILSIRKTNHPFDYQLVVWKGQPSDSDSLSDDENEDSDASDTFFDNESNILKSFIIDAGLQICLFERYHEKIISWRDMEGDLGDMFEYRINNTVPLDTIEKFMTTIYKCKYERKYKKSSSNVDVKDIQEFIVDINDININCLNSANTPSISSTLNMHSLLQSSNRNVAEDVEFAHEGDSDSDPNYSDDDQERNVSYDYDTGNSEDDDAKFVDAPETILPESEPQPEPQPEPQLTSLSAVASSTAAATNSTLQNELKLVLDEFSCSLYTFQSDLQAFKIRTDTGKIFFYETGLWSYGIEVTDELLDTKYTYCIMTDEIDPTFKSEQLAFFFNVFTDISADTWLCKFENRDVYDEFQSCFLKLMWQHKNKAKWAANEVDEQYLVDSLDLMDLDTDSRRESEEEEGDEEEDRDVEVERNEPSRPTYNMRSVVDSDESSSEEEDFRSKFDMNSKNKALVVGDKSDRAFISRGDKIGIFKTDPEGIEFAAAIDKLSFSKDARKTITPDKMMLLDNDRIMIVQDKNNMNNLHKIDLEYGKVVEDWNMENNGNKVDVENFTTNTKFGNLSHDQTFMGISSQSLFRVDPRVNSGFVAGDKTYKTKVNFKQISTTGEGYIAVAGKNGEIKLYDSLGKNAKTALPALGDEIIGLTTSNNGRYLLATCRTYLLLIDVKIISGRYEGHLGFERSFSANDKPMPRKLQLLPEHMAFIKQQCGREISFSIATFNETSHDDLPTYIASSLGPYAITWNFKKVLKNERNSYKLRKYTDKVVMGDFSSSNNSEIILTLPDNITMTSTNSFRKPVEEFNIVKTKF